MLSSVEEQVEVAAENETPTVGICFQDIAEVTENLELYRLQIADVIELGIPVEQIMWVLG